MKPKIIFITGFYPQIKGGAEYQMRIIADALKKYFDIIFVYIGDAPSYSVKETVLEIIDGYKVYKVKTGSKIDRYCAWYFLSRRVKKILRQEQPDIVYQRVYKIMSFYFAKFQKKIHYKFFIHIADLYSITFGKGFPDQLKKTFFNSICKTETQFIVQTEEQNKILQKLGMKPILQIYNLHPISTVSTNSIMKKQKDSIKNIVWIANIKPIKQVEVLIMLAEEFMSNKNIHFTIIGNTQDENYTLPLINKISQLKNITHYVDKDNVFVNDFLENEAHLVINTSICEGFSNVFIQGWLKGLPVYSLNSNPDGLFDKYPILGKCFKNSYENMKIAIEDFSNSELNKRNYAECCNLATKLFSIENNISQLKSILENCKHGRTN